MMRLTAFTALLTLDYEKLVHLIKFTLDELPEIANLPSSKFILTEWSVLNLFIVDPPRPISLPRLLLGISITSLKLKNFATAFLSRAKFKKLEIIS